MAAIVGQESIAGGYIGSSSASAIYIGAVLAWSAATPTPPTPPEPSGITYVSYVHSENMSDEQDNFINLGVYPNLTTRGKLTGKIMPWHNSGPFLGFTDDDDHDWRLFCTSYDEWYMDVAEERAESSCGLEIGDDFEIEFGNCYWSANTGGMAVSNVATGTLENYPIKLDMGMMWITSVELWTDGVKVFDGHAAESAGTYGVYDSISNTLLVSEDNDFDIVPESAFSGSVFFGKEFLYTELEASDGNYYTSSANSISLIKMLNTTPMEGDNWVEDETLGALNFEYSDNDQAWYLASSSLTSAITSFAFTNGEKGGELMMFTRELMTDPETGYRFKHEAELVEFEGKAGCWATNEHGSDDFSTSSYINPPDYTTGWMPPKQLIITDLPDFDQLHDMNDTWNVEIRDNDKFSFNMGKYYDWGKDDWVFDIQFDGYDNPLTTYEYIESANTLYVYSDWDLYNGEGQGEYTLNMKFSTNNCQYDDETYVAGEAQLQFTGYSETIQFDDGNPICETYLIIDISNIPNDGNVHEYKVMNSDNETLSVLKIDTSDWSYENTDDPDGYGYSFYTDEFDDQGDLSQGYARWKIKGQFIGTYYIYVDNVQLQSEPDYDGSEMVAFVNASTDTMDTFSCYAEWDCVENNPGCNWDATTRECDCSGV